MLAASTFRDVFSSGGNTANILHYKYYNHRRLLNISTFVFSYQTLLSAIGRSNIQHSCTQLVDINGN